MFIAAFSRITSLQGVAALMPFCSKRYNERRMWVLLEKVIKAAALILNQKCTWRGNGCPFIDSACFVGFYMLTFFSVFSHFFSISGTSPPSLEHGGPCCPAVWTWPAVWVHFWSLCSCITMIGEQSWPCLALSVQASLSFVWCLWRMSRRTSACPASSLQPRRGRREVSKERIQQAERPLPV